MDDDSSSKPAPKKTVRMWACDVCQQPFPDFDQACRHEEQCRLQTNTTTQDNNNNNSTTQQEWSCDVCHKRFLDYNEACQHEDACRQQQPDATTNKPLHPLFTTAQTTRKRKKTSTTKTKTTKKPKPQPALLAGIFTGASAAQVLAEHKAVEFAAKRRRAQAEREQHKKRQQQTTTTTKSHPTIQKKTPTSSFHVQFPVPSHVVVVAKQRDNDDITTDSLVWVDQESLLHAQNCLATTARHAGSEQFSTTTSSNNNASSSLSLLLPTNDKTTTITTLVDPLQDALMRTLLPPTTTTTSSTTCWSDKYSPQTIPEDVCGEHNQNTAQQLLSFVDDWKAERQRAHHRRAKKQQALLLVKSKKRSHRRRHDEDDDLWSDSDDDDESLHSVCLITGPSGSYKTSLVHAVARQCGCAVLEINTTERRGNHALKHAMEEATQSDSSLEMLKKTKRDDAFVDSDDDDETNQASVVIILIDEVDLMYEDDAGFWSALGSLTKKAKCPIFLTANDVPDGLANLRYRHVKTSLPTPMECVGAMLNVLRGEGFEIVAGKHEKELSLIAQLCKCDLRRIMNELQLYASAPRQVTNDGKKRSSSTPDESTTEDCSPDRFTTPVITNLSPKQVSPHDLSLLTISGRHFFSSFEMKVFVGTQLCPAARVVNDDTILAVCPPCLLPAGVCDAGVDVRTGLEVRTLRFAPVSIRRYVKNHEHVIATSDTEISTEQLCDGTLSIALGPIWNVEYAFPPPRSSAALDHARGQSEEEEFDDDDDDDDERKAPPKTLEVSSNRSSLDDLKEEADRILEKGVSDWNAAEKLQESGEINDIVDPSPDYNVGRKLNALSSQALLASDSAVLQDAFEFGGLPFLSGQVPGFGASLVNDVANEKRLIRDANAKPPSFERLFSLGWNDEGYFFGNGESYLCNPCDTRERRLLALSESHERGLSSCPGAATTSMEQDHDDEEGSVMESLSDAIKLHEAPRCVSEEDHLIRPVCSLSIRSFPFELRRQLKDFSSIDEVDLARLPYAMRDNAFQQARLLADLMEHDSDASSNRLICNVQRLLHASTTLLPLVERMDSDVFLDYLPLLRSMSIHERASEHAFQQVRAANPEAAAALSGRRTTRRSNKTMERKHYFGCNNSVANDMCSKLANHVLYYSSSE